VYAFVPDVRLVLAQLWPHLVLDGFDKIVFGIDTLFDDCLDRVPVFITMAPLALSAPRRFPRTRGFMCGYLDTGTPDHDIDHGISSHGYLDLGTASRSRLPRHRHKGYHLA
jgi:hypothetical protein